MSDDERNENEKRYRFTPPNAIEKWIILGIPITRWIEGILFVILTFIIIGLTPFVQKIKIISFIIIASILFSLSLFGIKNRSIIEFLIDIIDDNSRHGKFSLFPVNKNNKKQNVDSFRNESNAEILLRKSKEFLKEFDEKYDK